MKKSVCVLGGDLRQITVFELLKKENFQVDKMGLSEGEIPLENVKKYDIVILPMPVSGDGGTLNAPLTKRKTELYKVLEAIKEGALVLGAKMPEYAVEKLTARGIKYIDYYEREELIIKNAVPTAEGTIEIALSEMPVTLFQSRVLIVGYGRVGKVLAEKFSALGSYVTVSARKCADFAWIEEKGLKAIHTGGIADRCDEFDLIVNTVPEKILCADALRKMRKDALLIDLASKPGGVDFDMAKSLGKNVIWALSLPGKSAPITSGKIIKETIMNIFSETEV